MKFIYLAVRYEDLGYQVLSAWGSHPEAEAEAHRVFQADRAKNQHTEAKDYVVIYFQVGVKSK